MKLDRNINGDGLQKYAAINLRKLNQLAPAPGTSQRWAPEVEAALKTLSDVGVLEWAVRASRMTDEFFLIKLKDKHAMAALMSYSHCIRKDDLEFSEQVRELALRSGPMHPLCKNPD